MDVSGSATDPDLICESLSRPEAFAAIFERHFAAIHRYLARRAGVAVADDLASQTFLIAFDRRGSYRAQSDTALPWLLGIATNALHNHARAQRSANGLASRLRSAPTDDVPDVAQLALASSENTARAERVAAALAQLPDEQREVVLLSAWADLSYEAIAEALAIPIGTVRSRLARARAQLRPALTGDTVANATEERR